MWGVRLVVASAFVFRRLFCFHHGGRSARFDAAARRSDRERAGVRSAETVRLTTSELVAACRHPLDADMKHLTGIRERRPYADGEDAGPMRDGRCR